MYGGLFGDLPATKDSKKDGNDKDGNAEEAVATTKSESTATTVRTVEEPAQSKGPSLVQTLGSAGTSMAFVPTHINRKRKPATASTASTTIKKTPTATSVLAPSIATTELSAWKEERQQATAATMVEATNIHEINTITSSEQTTHAPPDFHIPQNTAASESEELQNLHESVTDPYDPLVPNDLLQYWETKAAIRERQELEREAHETMESQQRIREQLEQERHELEKSGDVAKLMQLGAGAGRGRGRGRGISNLPAWLVEKQKKEEEMRRLSS